MGLGMPRILSRCKVMWEKIQLGTNKIELTIWAGFMVQQFYESSTQFLIKLQFLTKLLQLLVMINQGKFLSRICAGPIIVQTRPATMREAKF